MEDEIEKLKAEIESLKDANKRIRELADSYAARLSDYVNYDYYSQVTDDCAFVINEMRERKKIKPGMFADKDHLNDHLYEILIDDDGVTGRLSGSYTRSAYDAEAYLCHNMDLVKEAWEEFDYSSMRIKDLRFDPERIDSLVRCYVLSQSLTEAIDKAIPGCWFYDEDEWRESDEVKDFLHEHPDLDYISHVWDFDEEDGDGFIHVKADEGWFLCKRKQG